MAWLAYVIVINFGDLLEAGSIPAKVLKNPYYVGVFCGLGYGALWRSKFFDFKSPVGKEKNIGFMTIFDGLLNYLMDRLEDIYSGAKIAKANELLKGKTIQNLPDHIKANLAGYRRLREEDKNEILKEIEEFNSKIANGGPAEIVIYGLVHKVVDHIGMGSLEDFIKTMK
ncbi:MAG: hypothetical protein HYW28_04370 [Rhodospirillales bacterium]|nr:hypothetical protein [Rhodospirillales bacterium]